MSLLNFHRAVKSANLSLATYLCAYNRLDYAQTILEFIARAFLARETHPDIWKRLESGELSVTKSIITFNSIGSDQAQEHDNKTLEEEGGLQGITNKPSTLLKYCLAAQHLGRFAKETEEMFCMAQDVHSSKQDPLSYIHTTRQENNVQAVLKPYKLFCYDGKQLFNFITKQVVRKESIRVKYT